jgi:MoaA/NifB/PqqE/SkfB family radical SAM enzyme
MGVTAGIIIKPSCRNSCIFCRKWPEASKEELKEQETAFLNNILEHKKRGFKRIEISGNDPIEYPNIIPLIRMLKQKMGFTFVQVSTHGLNLSDEEFAERFFRAGVDLVRIPIYGSNPDTHDKITQNPGSFKKTLEGIKNLKKRNIGVLLTSLILSQNKKDLINIYKLMDNLQPESVHFSIPCLINNSYDYCISYKEQKPLVKDLHDFARKSKGVRILFTEIPFCVFGYFSKDICNKVSPPDLGSFNQPDKGMESSKKDWPVYRLKKHTDICKKCKCRNICDGYFIRYIERFGTDNLRPV